MALPVVLCDHKMRSLALSEGNKFQAKKDLGRKDKESLEGNMN
jgi:hypothetical protein